MPDNTPEAKRAAVRRYGGEITYCAATLAARESAARELVERTGAAFVHPYDNLHGDGRPGHRGGRTSRRRSRTST